MSALVRTILSPVRGSDGLFIQPREVGPKRELVENHNRLRAANHGFYADPWTGNTRTYDPKGNYPCGTCNMVSKGLCIALTPSAELPQRDGGVGPVDIKAGSCEHYEDQCAGDPELRFNRLKGEYGQAQNGKGFGCHRCPMARKAHAPDSKGRDLYCTFWECRVLNTACCKYNSARTVSHTSKDLFKLSHRYGVT